jgi:3'(2'), 5'-bisphosphate nucleotidase
MSKAAPSSARLSVLLEAAVALAREAGARILEIQRGGYEVTAKADESPLTTADLAAHEILVTGLEALADPLPVLSEESAPAVHRARRRWRTFWLVDPLDGTRAFVRGDGEFSVNVALIHGDRPVLGVVHAPAGGRLWAALRGAGAWRERAGTRHPIRTRRVPATPVVAGSRSHGRPCLERFLRQIGPHRELRMSSIAKACLVAEGAADLYPRFGPTSEWDTAAAQCILEEAGGALTDFTGRPLRYNRRETLENPPFLAFGDPDHGWVERVARAAARCPELRPADAP